MVVPAGLVCFFPSYDYKEKVVKEWNQSGSYQKIDAKKKVHYFLADVVGRSVFGFGVAFFRFMFDV